jgi:CO dehydrogenase maturation factor
MAIIVFPGKGGVGKTSLSALTIKYFSEKGEATLALDLDPDSHLHKLLGVELRKTIGQIGDEIHKEKKLGTSKPTDISDQEYFLTRLAEEVLVEGEDFDLITLGKPSIDISCYCPVFLWANYSISQIMKSYSVTYNNIVVDCDPGTEIFPRKVLTALSNEREIDYILIVLDSSKMSLDTAKEIVNEVKRSDVKVKEIYGVCNRVDSKELQDKIKEVAKNNYGIQVVGFIPTDPKISMSSLSSQSLIKIRDSISYKAVKDILRRLNL